MRFLWQTTPECNNKILYLHFFVIVLQAKLVKNKYNQEKFKLKIHRKVKSIIYYEYLMIELK